MTKDQAPPNMKTLEQAFQNWSKRCLKEKEENNYEMLDKPPSQVLQEDSRSFFVDLTAKASKSNPIFQDGNIRIETKSPIEIALAKLIQDLGAAFSATHHESRYRALSVLVGAVQGCKETSFSNSVIQLVGGFLLKHCGPLDDDDYGEDYDGMIRNIAIQGLSALVELSSSSIGSDAEVQQAFEMRLQFAQEGIEMRCAVSDTMADNYAGKDMREQLSTLPRSKRALCFELIESAIKGVDAITQQISSITSLLQDKSGLQEKLVIFARFAASCLHGESDPRCLQQLLTIFHEMQNAFEPYFLESTHEDLVFPSEDLFDAVAPYFPIQFTPPPNNVHGITREGLNSALLAVLCYTKMDRNAIAHKRPPMINLTVGIFLEQVGPIDGEEPSTLDKLEGIGCLSNLLFPKDGTAMLDLLDVETLKSLWTEIKRTHDEASMEISRSGIEGSNNKVLADNCRTLVSRLAFALEMLPNKSLWDTFVSEPLLKQKKMIDMSPSHSKLNIAYMACLTASGGPRTLRFCLGVGLESLLDFLTENLEDTEDAAAATHGIGAFFSSCTVAIERGRKEGVVFHPHPLEQYASKASKVLLDTVEHKQLSTAIKIGATRALEFLVLAVSDEHLEGELVTRLCSFLESLSGTVTQQNPDDESDWVDTCSLTLGTILGNAVNQETTASSKTVLAIPSIQKIVTEIISPKLLDAAKSNSFASGASKKATAVACTLSDAYSSQTVNSLLESLQKCLEGGLIDDDCIRCSDALSYVLRNGGGAPAQAYHDSPLSSEVLSSLGGKRMRYSVNAEKIANLSIPTEESKGDAKAARQKIQLVLSNLLPAYEANVPTSTFEKLNRDVADSLPPLSDADKRTLSTTLPILGTTLSAITEFPEIENDDMDTDQPSLQEVCIRMLPGLTEFVMTTENDSEARSSAAYCMHTMLSLGNLGGNECPVKPVVDDLVKRFKLAEFDYNAISDWFGFVSLMASSAAKRGGSSSNTAGKAAEFFVELAVTGKAPFPFTDDNQLDLSSMESEQLASKIRVVAASSYGSMLALDVKPLMKQRLTHTCLKYVKEAYEEGKKQAQAGDSIAPPNVGLMVLICHLICHVDLSKMERMALHQTAAILVEGLSSSDFFHPNNPTDPKNTTSKNLTLVAILKLLSVAPHSVPVDGFLLTLVTGLLQAYAVSDPSSEVSTKLLALQGLVALTHLEGSKKAIASVQPAVVAVLGSAIDHPSGMLRQAAVDVRNAWYLAD